MRSKYTAVEYLQRARLRDLADHLDTIPQDNFCMEQFYAEVDLEGHVEPIGLHESVADPVSCGAVACAIGHGPGAGIPANEGEDWTDYATRAFGANRSSELFAFCFHDYWSQIDDTPTGAATRIRLFLTDCPIWRTFKRNWSGRTDSRFTTMQLICAEAFHEYRTNA